MNLDQLVSKVKKEHAEVVKAARTSLEHARNAGEYLADIRARLDGTTHDFKKWVPRNCGFTYRTALTYLRIHERWSELEKADASDLSIRGAEAMLKKPSDPKPPKPKLTLPRLAELMAQHGIQGEPKELLALLKEAGLKVTLAVEKSAKGKKAEKESEAATV